VEKLVILLDIEKVLTMTEKVRAAELAEAAVNHLLMVGGQPRWPAMWAPWRRRRRRDAWRRML